MIRISHRHTQTHTDFPPADPAVGKDVIAPRIRKFKIFVGDINNFDLMMINHDMCLITQYRCRPKG